MMAKRIVQNGYICGIVPKHGRSDGELGCGRVNAIIENEAWTETVTYILRTEDMSIDNFFEKDIVHVNKLGAIKIIDNISNVINLKVTTESKLKRVHETSPVHANKHQKNKDGKALSIEDIPNYDGLADLN